MVHFLGGLSVGLAAYWVLFDSGFLPDKPRRVWVRVASVLAVLMIAGIAWEIFEYMNGITDSFEAVYAVDVMNDLLADFLGAILAAFIGIKHTLLTSRPR